MILVKAIFYFILLCAVILGLPSPAVAKVIVLSPATSPTDVAEYPPKQQDMPFEVAVLSPLHLEEGASPEDVSTPEGVDEGGLPEDYVEPIVPPESKNFDAEQIQELPKSFEIAPVEPIIIEAPRTPEPVHVETTPVPVETAPVPVETVVAAPLRSELPPIEKAVTVDPLKLGPGGLVSPVLVAPLMAWVERETGVKVPVLPQVIASSERFRSILQRMGKTFAGRPQSAYVPGTVLLDYQRCDPEDSTQLSLLVHELVHHAQLYARASGWACQDAREAQAYTLQNKWLEDQGHYPFVNVAWIQRVSSCEDRSTGMYLAQKSSD